MFRLIKRLFFWAVIFFILRAVFYDHPFYQANIAPYVEPYVSPYVNALFDNELAWDQNGSDTESDFEKKNEEDPDTLWIEDYKTDYDSLHPCNIREKFTARIRRWEDWNNHKYKGKVVVSQKDACESEKFRENLEHPYDYDNYWPLVYQHLAEEESPRLNEVFVLFEKIGKEKNLNYEEFAKMVISFVQEIPYVLIHPGSCQEDISRGGFTVEYHNSKKECLPNKKFGIQTASEFMYNFKGDCDTRAVFAYLVLRHFGYDVAVLGSPRHAMLGINLPSHGNYLMYQGKKYFFWETTGKGWVIGAIPPEYQNDQWTISLMYKTES